MSSVGLSGRPSSRTCISEVRHPGEAVDPFVGCGVAMPVVSGIEPL